jgi:hypothetical protein
MVVPDLLIFSVPGLIHAAAPMEEMVDVGDILFLKGISSFGHYFI